MKNKTILLAEDTPDDVQLTLQAFKKCNITSKVVVAENGAEALDYLFGTGSHVGRDLHDQPTLILLDLKLPKIDGFEVLRRIRADHRTKRLPAVVLTSSKEERDVLSCYELGANSYILKSANFDHFVEVIRQLGLYWLLLNEPTPLGRPSSIV